MFSCHSFKAEIIALEKVLVTPFLPTAPSLNSKTGITPIRFAIVATAGEILPPRLKYVKESGTKTISPVPIKSFLTFSIIVCASKPSFAKRVAYSTCCSM